MPFQLSPGVNVTEIDLTTIVPAVSSSVGAIAGVFNWGPVNERVLIDSETNLVSVFGKPNSNNAETWFTAANFLGYTDSLYVVRAANTTYSNITGTWNAFANADFVGTPPIIKNKQDFEIQSEFDNNLYYVARYPGALGNSLRVSVCDSANAYTSTIQLYKDGDTSASINVEVGSKEVVISVVSVSEDGGLTTAFANEILANFSVGDNIALGNSSIGLQYAKVTALGGLTTDGYGTTTTSLTIEEPYRLSKAFVADGTGVLSPITSITRQWEYYRVVGTAPTTSEYVANFGNASAVDTMHIVIVDEMGKFTGTPGAVLETYVGVSRATDAKTVGGQTNYFNTIINQSSRYIWAINDRNGLPPTAMTVTSSSYSSALTLDFANGQDGEAEGEIDLATIATGYDLFASTEDVDISLILQGKPIGGSSSSSGYTVSNFQLANFLIDNIAAIRKDCVVFITPDDNVVTSNVGQESSAIVAWRNIIHDSSYAVMDSGYKYQYDRYNDIYRYVPTNGDIAGLCARTDSQRDPWWSPAGLNRGQIKNVVKMRFNPRHSARDNLYKNGVNSVVSFPGQGTILYGDKTLQSKPSAFDRINVRRLFIVLEKAIAVASKYTLFEFNDEFTRSQFKNLVTPYLRDVQGRRGITDFLVVCDATNNTPERVDRNEFWGDIYIKPARSINFIQLNFVAVATGVQFSEVVGKF